MNTKFLYLYRDAGNNKSRAAVIFKGAFKPEDAERLRRAFDSSTYFIAEQVGVPVAYLFRQGYEFDEEIDHCYHEFDDMELTEEQPNDGRTIAQFVTEVQRQAERGWELPEWLIGTQI